MNNQNVLRFNNANRQFYTELKKRVDNYFREKKLSKNGNANMYAKTVFMFAAYLVPYFLILFNVTDSRLAWFFITILMGLAMAGIGLCVMHDANHGSFSRSTKLNRFIGSLSMNLLGGYSLNWRIQHNVIHHTYTNVHEHDEDIAPPGFMRFEPHSEKKWIHKLQFIYAWFFYGMMTMMWSTTKDFRQLYRYHKEGHLKTAQTTYRKELTNLILAKGFYHSYMILPFLLVPGMSFLEWLFGFLILHYVAGLVLALIFQSAHVVQEAEFPLPVDGVVLENHWAEHQMRTTMNFATGDPVFSWLVGGLNYQVEHHLFPNICHVHYPKISSIVESTAREFNVPYKSQRTFVGAIWSHQVMLWKLGRV
jgi:linoleoyl-CoA desaturase